MVVKRTEEMDFREFELCLNCNTKAWKTVQNLGEYERNRVWNWLEKSLDGIIVNYKFLVNFFGEERELVAHILGYEDWESYCKASRDKEWKERHEHQWLF